MAGQLEEAENEKGAGGAVVVKEKWKSDERMRGDEWQGRGMARVGGPHVWPANWVEMGEGPTTVTVAGVGHSVCNASHLIFSRPVG